MPVNVNVTSNLDEVIAIYNAAPEKFNRRMRAMQTAVLLVERTVKKLTPVNTGALRSSMGHEIRFVGAEFQGVVGTSKAYAPYVELGTRPHWPPVAPIRYWVQRKLKLTGADLERVTFLVRRKIALVGTQGARMFQQAFEQTQAQIIKMWDDIWGEAIEKDL